MYIISWLSTKRCPAIYTYLSFCVVSIYRFWCLFNSHSLIDESMIEHCVRHRAKAKKDRSMGGPCLADPIASILINIFSVGDDRKRKKEKKEESN